jgi:hypothetical protein
VRDNLYGVMLKIENEIHTTPSSEWHPSSFEEGKTE